MIVDKNKVLKGDHAEFLALLRPHFMPSDDGTKTIDAAYRIEAAEKILAQKTEILSWSKGLYNILLTELGTLAEIPAQIKAELRFSLMVLDVIGKLNNLEPILQQQLIRLRPLLLANAIAEPTFWISPQPLRSLFDNVYTFALGYREDLGKGADPVADVVQATVAQCLQLSAASLSLSSSIYNDFKSQAEKALERGKKVSLRLTEGETGALKAKVAHQHAVSFINQLFDNKLLPVSVSRFIAQDILNELKLLLISGGMVSVEFLKQKKLLTTLLALYQTDLDMQSPVNKTFLNQLPTELEKSLESTVGTSEALSNFIAQVSFDFAVLASGKPLAGLEPAELIEEAGDNLNVNRQVSKALLDKARAYPQGQWFIYRDEGSELKRVCLLLNLLDYEQMLFANLLGQKVLTLSYENFAFLLSEKVLQPLFQGELTALAVSLVVDKLLQGHEELHLAMLDQADQRSKQLQLKKKQLKIEQEKLQAATMARAEAAQLAEDDAREKKRSEKEKREQLLAQIDQDARRQIRLSLDSLALGSWVEKLDEAGENYKRIKLAVKFNATNRFVFVDEDGITVAEHIRDELVDLILEEKIRLLESDQHFADRLAKIVSNIRKNGNNDN